MKSFSIFKAKVIDGYIFCGEVNLVFGIWLISSLRFFEFEIYRSAASSISFFGDV
jgi:hypothetical protein